MDAEYSCIPDYTLKTLKAYVGEGRPTGDFLRAVLENNLAEAVGHADRNNYSALREIIKWLFNHASASCWGTPSKVQGWLKSHLRAKQEEIDKELCLSAEEIRQRLSRRKEPNDTSKRTHICLPSKEAVV